jgi:RNA polymerase sigma-70 factor (ECF subfamily)
MGHDRGALQEVVRQRSTDLHAIARRLTRNDADAADLVGDAIERAVRSAPMLSAQELMYWLISTIRHLFVDQCRQRRTRTRAERTLRRLAGTASDEVENAPPWTNWDEADVMRAAEQLAPPFRDVLRLHAGRVPLAEMAATLQIPRATAGTRLFRARRKLKKLLMTGVTDGRGAPTSDSDMSTRITIKDGP